MTDLERVSSNTTVNSTGSGGRALSANVRKLHHALNALLDDFEREHFVHCLNVYHAKRNVFDLVQTLKVILNTAHKRQLLPMLRLVIPRSDQLLFDQYTSEGLYLKADLGRYPSNGDAETALEGGHSNGVGLPANARRSPRPRDGFSTAADGTVPVALQVLGGFAELRQVTLKRSRSHEGLGFSIRGGSEHGVGIHVSLVEPGSSAEREGLRIGDQIVVVNDMVFDRVSHVEAVKVLKGCKTLAMSVCSAGRVPAGCITNHVYSWVDPQGRSVSPPPPPDAPDQDQALGPDGARTRCAVAERTVNLNMEDGRSLGLMIRGGAEYGLGVFITGVDPGSAADAGPLKVGDQILEVNGRSFVAISHDEAVHILKTGHRLRVKVRDVGRLPHARTAANEARWISDPALVESAAAAAGPHPEVSRPTSARPTSVLGKPPVCGRALAPPGTQVSLERQAYLLLTEAERQTMAYYLHEYQEGHIGVEPLAMALFELFNTHAKLSMLSEVRALVAPQDLEAYEGLVLRRERGAPTAWRGGPGTLQRASAGHGHFAKNESPEGAEMGQDEGAGGISALRDAALDDVQSSCDSPPHAHQSTQTPPREASRERTLARRPSPRLAQAGAGPGAGLLFKGPTRLLQDCLHKSLKALPSAGPPPHWQQAAEPPSRHFCAPRPSLVGFHHGASFPGVLTPHTCHSTPQLHSSSETQHRHHHPRWDPHGQHPHPSSSSSGHHTCPGLLHQGEPAAAPQREAAAARLSSRSASYERSSSSSCVPTRSASPLASPRPSPLPSPLPSPCPSPCPSVITPAPPPCSPDRPCSPALVQRTATLDVNRLSAEARPQQRGATLSQLSDGGQTLSEDSGVDIAEASGLSKNGSPRPSKNQQGPVERPAGHAPTSQAPRQSGSPVPLPTATLVRVAKNASTLGIAIEGGANTRQPLPRIVTIQKGGSAHGSGQLRVGHVILEVNGVPLHGREHRDAARVIAEAFKTRDSDHVDFLVVEPGS